MGTKLSTTLKKLESDGSMNKENRVLLQEFYQDMRSKGSRSECNTNNLLTLLLYFDKFLSGKPFTSINRKERILEFLDLDMLVESGGNENMTLKGNGLLVGTNTWDLLSMVDQQG